MAQRHPLFRRIIWHPLVAGCVFGYHIYRSLGSGLTGLRVAALLVCGLWYVLSVIDLKLGHRCLDWMYDKED